MTNYLKKLLFFLLLIKFSCYAQYLDKRIVLVLSKNFNSPKAKLFCWEYKDKQWKLSQYWPVTIGRNGLGWGIGLHKTNSTGPIKREGDGKSPAGIFKIRQHLYGYSKHAPVKWKKAYTCLTSSWVGVDDPKSKYYNKIIDKNTIRAIDWKSCEKMCRNDNLYKWVLVIEHNTKSPIPKKGSCIFLHLWRSKNSPTAGCTAMSEKNLLRLIKWIQFSDDIIIVQLPYSKYNEFQKRWNFPRLDELHGE